MPTPATTNTPPARKLPPWVQAEPNVGGAIKPSNVSTPIEGDKPEPEPPPTVPPVETPLETAKTPDPVPPPTPPETPPAAPVPAPAKDENEDWPRSKKDWDKFTSRKKEQLAKVQAELNDIRAQRDKAMKDVEDLRASGATSAEIKAMKDERDRLDQILRETNLERHPKFKEYYDGHIGQAQQQIKAILGDDKGKAFSETLSLPPGEYRDSRLEELISELPMLKVGQVASLVTRISDLQAERSSELAKARENSDKIQGETAAQQAQRQKATEAMVLGAIHDIQGTELKGVLEDTDAAAAKKIAIEGTPDPRDFVKMIARGMAYPKLLKGWAADKAKISELEKTIAGLQAATPQPGGERQTPTERGGERRTNKPPTPFDAARLMVETFNKAGMGGS